MSGKTKLQEELETIREDNNGVLRAEDVIRYAEDHPDSVLYGQFTWDNEVAAIHYRLSQARRLIRMHVFVIPNSSSETRIYVSLEQDRMMAGGGYRHIHEVMSDAAQREMLLRQALREIQRWRQKYQNIKELAIIFSSIDEIDVLEAINQDTLDIRVDQARAAA